MADEYSINAKITADSSGFEKGVNKAQKASKNLSKSVSSMVQGLGKNGLVGALGAVGLAGAGLSVTLGAIVKVAKKVSQTIDECSEAYRKQYQAEVALATAVNNNPYVDGTATKRLKDFASEMQRVSDVGDEELLPMMAQLIATGRTEEETMQIMSVALDMSASGAMSLDTAITQLNATLNGNVGRLGQQNSELKDLTEEELKQGKAVEILGAKYKGLAQTTADSQKQLKNAIGDLKENLGKVFETALAPMRRYFTEVITNLNNSIQKSRELKGAMKEVFGGEGVNLEASTDSLNIAFSEILHKQQEVTKNYRQYIQLYGKYIDQTTDETVLSYKQQIEELNAQMKAISEELNRRRQETEEEKKKLAQAKADEERQKELEELAKLNAEKQTLQKEWEDKLFNIRIENLEKTRSRELDNEELTQEQRLAINDFYGSQILAMKIKQLEEERNEILKDEKLTEEARVAVSRYYENKITQAKQTEADKALAIKKKENKEEEKEDKKRFSDFVKMAMEATKKVAETFKNVAKKIGSTMKNVLSGIGNIFGKALDIFKFNPDDALVSLLKIEDSILTFFVETLPKLPAFFASAIQSIMVLLNNLVSIIDWEGIQKMLDTMIDAFIQNAPTIVDNILDIVINIVQTVLNALIHFVEAGGWKMILNMLLTIQKRVEQFFTDNIDSIADTIESMLPDLMQFISESIVSASRTLGKLAPKIIPLIADLINTIIEAITSDEVLDSFFEALEGLVDGLVQAIMKLLQKAVPKLVSFGTKLATNPQTLLKMTVAIIKGLISAFAKTDWKQVVKDIFTAFIDGVKNLFGIHSPSTLFEEFGEYMIEGLILGIQGMADALNSVLQPIYNLVVNIFGQIGNIITSSISVSFSGLTSLLGGINSGIAQITNSVANLINSLANLIDKANQAVSALNPLSGGSSGGGGSTATRVGLAIATGGLSELPHLFGFANGTQNVPKGLSIVGEAGPELVKFNGGEQVLNNQNTNKALENMGGKTNNFNVTFNNLQDTTAFNMMQQLKAYNRQMAINGVI